MAGTVVFLLLEFTALSLLKSSSTLQDIWLNRVSYYLMGKLWGGGESLRSHFSLKDQNDKLHLENEKLRAELSRYRELGYALLEDSLKIAGGKEFVCIPATVTKMSRNSAHNYIILNKGRNDGVKPYSGIVSGDGVVGIISSVGKNYSYGLTLMNSNISVSARVGHFGMVGVVMWDGRHSNKAILKNLPLHYEVERGDTLYTSGFSTIFPPDIPIGVTGSSSIAYGSTSEIEVTLFQDFSNLRYVTIEVNPAREEILQLEKENRI